jgi:enoyl-CoA hydratase/carnithine racemase
VTGDQAAPGAGQDQERTEPLLTGEELEGLRMRWGEIQTRFIDDPKEAVQAADQLVAEVMHKLASTFAERKQGLEHHWQHSNEVATEDLRVVLRQYRSFFNRLLST